MNNSSLLSADRTTHVKIVVVSLLASIVVIAVGIEARSQPPESFLKVTIQKPPKTITVASGTGATMR